MTEARNIALIDDLRRKPAETAWIEFKENNCEPQKIGEWISALSNAARMADEHFAYLIWGIRNGDHAVMGTVFEPSTATAQQQPLEFWLAQRLNPSVNFVFKIINHPDGRLVLLEIPAANAAPIEFDRTAFIRIGSATPRLSDYPDRLQALWAKLQSYAWESGIAAQFVTGDEVLSKLDYASYFRLTQQPLPDNRTGIFERLKSDRLITADVGGNWNITNLGAILFADNLDNFELRIARKGVRFVAYNGSNRASPVTHRQDGKKGYANGFQKLMDYIDGMLPRNEHIGTAFREEHPLFPEIALREFVANALIHQDMTLTGTGPKIELFKDRIEITNPGKPLVRPERFIDAPPRSRNETMAALMRRMHICEEDGSGVDKAINAVELYQLPPPDIRETDDATIVVIYGPRRFADLTPEERIRACYQHAALKFVSGDRMKNSSLRERFGIEERNASQVSQVIRQALEAGLIKPADPERPQAAYIPSWA